MHRNTPSIPPTPGGNLRHTIAYATGKFSQSSKMPADTDTIFCYHCRTHHAKAEMRLLVTKTGKRWRCLKSIEATKQGKAAREAYGRQMTETNKAEARSKARLLNAHQ